MRIGTHRYVVLAILTTLNLLAYIDRSILFQVQPLIQQEFGVTKTQLGLLTTAFMTCFVIAAPILGFLEDRCSRRPIIALGAIVWSISTLLTGATSEFHTLLIRHAVVGVGEACMVAAPGYIADLFPEGERGRGLSFLYMSASTGTALGFMIGGTLAHLYGWRMPFYVVSGPGILLALMLLLTDEPKRGAQDAVKGTAIVGDLVRNRSYLTATLGLAFIAFALGGAQVWFPYFLVRVRGMSMVATATFIGVITAINGVGASLTGGWLADRVSKRRQANSMIPFTIAAAAVPLMLAAIYVPKPAMFPAMYLLNFVLLLNYVPLGATVVRSVGPQLRSTAFAFHFVVLHLFGHGASPPIIGYVADRTGSLQLGLTVTAAALALSSLVLLYGSRPARITERNANPPTAASAANS